MTKPQWQLILEELLNYGGNCQLYPGSSSYCNTHGMTMEECPWNTARTKLRALIEARPQIRPWTDPEFDTTSSQVWFVFVIMAVAWGHDLM